MAELVPHLFNRYQLTEQEETDALSSISDLTRMYLQSRLADIMEEKVALVFDPNNPQKFIQAEAELRGAGNLLLELITLSA